MLFKGEMKTFTLMEPYNFYKVTLFNYLEMMHCSSAFFPEWIKKKVLTDLILHSHKVGGLTRDRFLFTRMMRFDKCRTEVHV